MELAENATTASEIRISEGGATVSSAVSGTLTYSAGSSNPASLTEDLTSGYATTFSAAANAIPTIVLASPANDAVNEEHETFTVTLNAGTGYTVGTPSTLTVTIIDNDPPAAPPLTLTTGNGQQRASWTKPAGPVTGYQLRYKEVTATDQAATTAGGPVDGLGDEHAVGHGHLGGHHRTDEQHDLPGAGAGDGRADPDRQRLGRLVGLAVGQAHDPGQQRRPARPDGGEQHERLGDVQHADAEPPPPSRRPPRPTRRRCGTR